jgi:carbon monoxide dehydrogenase subunit G
MDYMNLSGTVPFTASPTAVWRLLTTPEQLCACMPGLQDWQAISDQHFQLNIAWQFGPDVQKPVPVTIRWNQLRPPSRLDTTAVFHLNQQQVEINGRFTLTPATPRTTELQFKIEINSPNPFIDQLARSLAPRLIDTYFACLQTKASRPKAGPDCQDHWSAAYN